MGLSPNAVTILSVPAAVIAAFFFMRSRYEIAVVFLVISLLLDGLDDGLADIQNGHSSTRSFLDATVARISETFFFLGFVFDFPLAAFLAVCGANLVSYSKARAGLVLKTDSKNWPNRGNRTQRLLLLLLGVIVSLWQPSVFGFATMELFLWFIVLLVWIGGINRIWFGLNSILAEKTEGTLAPDETQFKKKTLFRRKKNE